MNSSLVKLLVVVAVVIAIVCAWLGAVLSQSLLAVELATAATNLLLLLSIAPAIWHPQVATRRFWTGFCILGLGSVVLGTYFSAYANLSAELARLIAGDVAYGGAPMGYSGGFGIYPPQGSAFGLANGLTTIYTPLPLSGTVPPAISSFEYHQCVLVSVKPIVSLLAACIGSWLTLLISWPTRTERAS